MKKNLLFIAVHLLITLNGYSFTQNVTVQNHVFTPASFSINLGDTIRWTWVGGSHTTTSLTIPSGSSAWDHSITSSSTTFVYVPSKTGTYNYKCTPHFAMGMTGSFTVVCQQATVQISAAGANTFCKGGSVQLNSSVSSGITSRQWQKGGTNIAGETGATYIAKANGSYTLKVTNGCGSMATSNAIIVTVNTLPEAVITPSGSVNLCSGNEIILQATVVAGVAYQWQRGVNNISGATSATYKTAKGGSYKVVVTKTSTGCVKTSKATKVTVVTCNTSDFAEFKNNEIKIYPNPSANSFNVSIASYKSDDYFLIVFDLNGKMVGNTRISAKTFSFGNSLNPGIYFIEVRKANTLVAREKVIKEK